MISTTTSRKRPLFEATFLFAVLLPCMILTMAVQPVESLRYMGIDAGHQQHVYDSWEAKTGKTVHVTLKPLIKNIEEAQVDMKQNLNFFDVYQIHPAMTSFAEKKWIRELTNDVKDPKFKWPEILLSVRKLQTEYNGATWSIPVDTDGYLMYYRRDLISSPPTTWEEYIEVAKKWHGKDINGDGIPDFGTCTITEGQFNKLAYTIAATVMKYKKGSRQGFVYDVSDRDDELMTNLLETEGWAYTMELVKEIWKYGQGTEVFISEAFKQFREGRCATYISFGSAGTQTVAAGSKIKGKLGVARAPGSSKVYDRVTKSLVPCDAELCPLMESASKLNRPSYIVGGIQLIVNGQLEGQALEDALDFCAHFTNNVDVRLAGALNPFRDSHFNVTSFTEAAIPWDLQDAQQYTSALRGVYDLEHTLTTPPLPTDVILNTNIDRAIKEYVRLGQYNTSTDDLPTIMKNCVKHLNEESLAEGFTPEILEGTLRQATGLPPYSPPTRTLSDDSFPYWAIVILIVLPVTAIAVVAVLKMLLSGKSHRHAPKSSPCCIIFTDIESSTTLWGRAPDLMGAALDLHNDVIRKCIAKNNVYEVKTIGDSFMVAAETSEQGMQFALDVQQALIDAPWDQEAVEEFHKTYSELHAEKGWALLQSDRDASLWRGLRVRVAMTFGEVAVSEEHHGFDYHGPTVNMAARLESIGHGGQIIVSREIVDGSSGFLKSNNVIQCHLEDVLLRGMDEKVPITQICSSQFSRRQYATLRLDKQRDHSDNESVGTSKTYATSQASEAVDLAEYPEVNAFAMLQTLLGPLNPSNTKTVLEILTKSWRIQMDSVASAKSILAHKAGSATASSACHNNDCGGEHHDSYGGKYRLSMSRTTDICSQMSGSLTHAPPDLQHQ